MDLIQLKKDFRYCTIRSRLIQLSSNGHYKQSYQYLSQIIDIPYNTFRQDIKAMERLGLLSLHKGITLKKWTGRYHSLYHLYKTNEEKLQVSLTGAQEFASMALLKIFKNHVMYQLKREAAKVDDKRVQKKFLRSVQKQGKVIGALQGVYCSLHNVGKLFHKSKTTAFRYIKKLEDQKILKVVRTIEKVCLEKDYKAYRRGINDALRGKTFVSEGVVFERQLNQYAFI